MNNKHDTGSKRRKLAGIPKYAYASFEFWNLQGSIKYLFSGSLRAVAEQYGKITTESQ